jgi:hypothetical protein
MSEFIDKRIKSFNTFLDRWNGTQVEVRELSVSHKTLTLRLYQPEKGFLEIHCIRPLSILLAKMYWDTAEIKIAFSEKEGFWCLVDANAGLITCDLVEMTENLI